MNDKTAPFKMPALEELDPAKSPILYHYCSLETFLSIIQFKSLRLSDINTMNDYSEMHWAYEKFVEAVNIVREHYEDSYFDFLDLSIGHTQLNTLMLVACFSTDGDVLSQWRAYGDNGLGVAVGFDSQMMSNLAIRLGQVTYDPALQVQYYRDLLVAAYPWWKLATDDAERDELSQFISHQTFDMCLMKNPAFSEEKEVRIARAVTVHHDDDGWHLKDPGGNGPDKASRRKSAIKYRAKGAGLVAHLDLPIGGIGPTFIKEIVIGPRSSNNGIELSMALTAQGFKGCQIRKSKVTYR